MRDSNLNVNSHEFSLFLDRRSVQRIFEVAGRLSLEIVAASVKEVLSHL